VENQAAHGQVGRKNFLQVVPSVPVVNLLCCFLLPMVRSTLSGTGGSGGRAEACGITLSDILARRARVADTVSQRVPFVSFAPHLSCPRGRVTPRRGPASLSRYRGSQPRVAPSPALVLGPSGATRGNGLAKPDSVCAAKRRDNHGQRDSRSDGALSNDT
jgi:hypothetical protein